MAKEKLYQRRGNDCGVACIAMLLGETYKNAYEMTRHYFVGVLGEKFDGITAEQIRGVSAMFGERAKVWLFTKKNRSAMKAKLQGRKAILIVTAHGYPPGAEHHAVFWDGKAIHDPSPKNTCYRFPANGKAAFKDAIACIVLHDECQNDSIEVC